MKHIRHLILLLLVAGGLATLTGCICDDDFAVAPAAEAETPRTHTVRIAIAAGDTNNNTRSSSTTSYSDTDADRDLNATQYEYINSLAVFIVDNSGSGSESNGRIMWKFCTDSNATSETDKPFGGDVTSWTSDEITLNDGSYAIYAFANWETVVSTDSSTDDAWQKIINKVEYVEENTTSSSDDYTLSDTDLTFYVDDPAQYIDLTSETKQFIPMSGKYEFTLGDTSGSSEPGDDAEETISCDLVRLVSKVTIGFMDIVNTALDAGDDNTVMTITNLSISGFANKVPLFSDMIPTGSDVDSPTYTMSYSPLGEGGSFTVKYVSSSQEEPTDSITFYVNAVETEQTDGFKISFDVAGGSQENEYTESATCSTKATQLERNHILPIYISLTDYDATVTAKYYTAAIGGEEKEYKYTGNGMSTFSIEMYDVTTKVELTPSITNAQDATYSWADNGTTWSSTSTETGSIIGSVSDTDGTATINIPTAYEGWEYNNLSFTAEWTSAGGISHKRTYKVLLSMTNGMPTFNGNLPRWVGPWQLATPTVGNTTVPSGATATKVTTSGNTTTVISPAATSYGEIITIPLR